MGQASTEADKHTSEIERILNLFHKRIHVVSGKVERCTGPDQIVPIVDEIMAIVPAQDINPIVHLILLDEVLGHLNHSQTVEDSLLHILGYAATMASL